MAVKVRIPAPLRKLCNGQSLVEVEAGTLGQSLSALDALFPGIKERLLDREGKLQPFVNVFINGEDARFMQELDTPLKPGDEISIVPAVAGG